MSKNLVIWDKFLVLPLGHCWLTTHKHQGRRYLGSIIYNIYDQILYNTTGISIPFKSSYLGISLDLHTFFKCARLSNLLILFL
jgi:hypothetical protein